MATVFMVDTLIQLSAWFFLLYFLLINGSYLLIQLVSLLSLRNKRQKREVERAYELNDAPFSPGVAILLPAYNEAPVVVSSVRSLLSVEYPDAEVVAINDGSSDDTLERLKDAFDLQRIDVEYPLEIPCEPVRDIYRATAVDLVVIDKENGGKSDALNAGLFFTDQPLFCAVDADTVIEQDSLLKAARPLLRYPEQMVATGGTVRVSNGCSIEHSVIREVTLPDESLAGMQAMEYLRAFLTGRTGLSEMNSLLIISGAFGLFRASSVREIGGYSTDTITEDLELVVRLHRHFEERDQNYRMEFVPEAVVWTEVPEELEMLGRQRNRWYRGLLETLLTHRQMIGRSRFGTIGMVAMPFYLLVELLGPIVEGLGYLLVPTAYVLGFLNFSFFLLFFGVAVGLGILMSWLSVWCEVYVFRRYTRMSDILRLMSFGIFENIFYRQWKAWIAFQGLVDYLKGDTSWGEMTRLGFEDE